MTPVLVVNDWDQQPWWYLLHWAPVTAMHPWLLCHSLLCNITHDMGTENVSVRRVKQMRRKEQMNSLARCIGQIKSSQQHCSARRRNNPNDIASVKKDCCAQYTHGIDPSAMAVLQIWRDITYSLMYRGRKTDAIRAAIVMHDAWFRSVARYFLLWIVAPAVLTPVCWLLTPGDQRRSSCMVQGGSHPCFDH